MAESNVVSAGDDILSSQYNNLRKDVLDNGLGHYHTGAANGGRLIPESSLAFSVATQAELDAIVNVTTGHDHDGVDSKLLVSGEYGARATKNVNQTGITGAAVKVTFEAETWDIKGEFATSKYIATTAGYYQINSSLSFASSDSQYSAYTVYIYKNGSSYSLNKLGNSSALTRTSVWISDLVYLAVTDYIEIYFENGDNVGTVTIYANGGSGSTFLSIIKVKSVL